MKKWLTVDRVLLGLIAFCLLAVVVSQWIHAVQFDETVTAWEKCLEIPGQSPDCDDWSRIPEERRERWLFQIGADDPDPRGRTIHIQVEDARGNVLGTHELVLSPESYSEEPADLRAGFPAVMEGSFTQFLNQPDTP